MPKILVVDGEPVFVELVAGYLKQKGFEVIAAYDGPTALRKVREERPDLVTLEIMLAGMDGFEVLEQIRSGRETHKIPVIMVSARGTTRDMERASELYVQHYSIKPIDPDQLFLKICQILRISATA